MRAIRKALGTLLTVAIALAAMGGPVKAGTPTTRYVDDDGTAGRWGCNDTRSVPRRVQRAIHDAGPGDTILVCPGTYTEQLTIRGARDGLTVRAVEPWTAVILTPRSLNGSPSSLITIDDVDRVRVQWFKLAIRTAEPCEKLDRAVWVQHAHETEIRSLRIGPLGSDTIGPCGYRDGIVVSRRSSAFIGYNVVRDFTDTGIRVRGAGTMATASRNAVHFFHTTEARDAGCGTGISAELEPLVTIRANVIRSGPRPGWHTPSLCSGMTLLLGDASVVARNTVHRARLHGILAYWDDFPKPKAFIRGNVITGGTANSSGLFVLDASTYSGNRVSGYGYGAFVVSSDATFVHNDFRGNDRLDCFDESNGSTWIDNIGDTSEPSGICSPVP